MNASSGIRDALLVDSALRAPELPALDHRTMFKLDMPEARIETLGVETTNRYAAVDLEAKRAAIAKTRLTNR